MKQTALFLAVTIITWANISLSAPAYVDASVRPTISFRQDLEVGSTGEDVRALQAFLNANGYAVSETGVGSAGYESDYFGAKTQNALSMFQLRAVMSSNSSALLLELGRLAPVTRAYINSNGQFTRTEVRRRGKPSSSTRAVSVPEVVVPPLVTFPQMRVSWALSLSGFGSTFGDYEEISNHSTINNNASPYKIFSVKIENLGDADLNVVGEGLSFVSDGDFATTSSPVFPIAPNASTTFDIGRNFLSCNQSHGATSTISTDDPTDPEFEVATVFQAGFYSCS